MHDPERQEPGSQGRSRGERYPMRRLSSTGDVTTGWRSTLETGRDQGFGTFLVGTLIAGGIFTLIAWLLIS
jgi:hypothetical protein